VEYVIRPARIANNAKKNKEQLILPAQPLTLMPIKGGLSNYSSYSISRLSFHLFTGLSSTILASDE
jgi:hypothetical protein